mmetsp:Transcript_21145/g.58280  ORF Transcript_21145/g.58280 Transcript_21145/m.58280 type:complete len:100 (+) Transcript_21145:1150-1449(+)
MGLTYHSGTPGFPPPPEHIHFVMHSQWRLKVLSFACVRSAFLSSVFYVILASPSTPPVSYSCMLPLEINHRFSSRPSQGSDQCRISIIPVHEDNSEKNN